MLGPKAVCHYFPPYWTSLGPYPTKKKIKQHNPAGTFQSKIQRWGKIQKKSVQSTWTLESGAWLGQSECLLDPKIQFSFPLALESPEHNPSIQSQWSNCQPAVSKKKPEACFRDSDIRARVSKLLVFERARPGIDRSVLVSLLDELQKKKVPSLHPHSLKLLQKPSLNAIIPICIIYLQCLLAMK